MFGTIASAEPPNCYACSTFLRASGDVLMPPPATRPRIERARARSVYSTDGSAAVAQWQSSCFVNSRSWVQAPPAAPRSAPHPEPEPAAREGPRMSKFRTRLRNVGRTAGGIGFAPLARQPRPRPLLVLARGGRAAP